MTELASAGQLRAAYLRWALVLVPGIPLLGMLSGAAAGSVASNPWFAGLVKPAIYPPPAAFGIVWSILYLMMGLALTSIVVAWGARGRGLAITLFGVQLVLNLGWSPVFFAFHRIAAAQVLRVAIDCFVAATVWAFFRVRRGAGLMLVPYLGWVLFATVLNWQFLMLNPAADGASGAPLRIEFKP